jgi:anti-sigma regulatory factor (Ser/Thr protein kinase)
MTTSGTDFVAQASVAGGPRLRRRVFPGRADQVARAREFTARTLAGCPAVADAMLLTSELGTNALLHTVTGTGGTFTVTICHPPSIARVAVTDNGPLPVPAIPPGRGSPSGDGLVPSGRGLLLVASLAARWGYHGSGQGRVTWFELPCASSSCAGSDRADPGRACHAGS